MSDSDSSDDLEYILDPTLFQATTTECTAKSSSIKEGCASTMRIIHSLPFYQSLHLETDDYKQAKKVREDQEKLVEFYKETYKSVLDDFVHLVSYHHNDLDEISDILINDKSLNISKYNCDVLKCKLSQRHNRDREKETDFDMNHFPAVKMSQNDHETETFTDHNEEHEKSDLSNDIGSESEDCATYEEETVIAGVDNDDTCDSNETESDSEDWLTYELNEETAFINVEDDDLYDLGQTDSELEFIFIRNLFDAMHCYILHSYDFGFRVHQNDKQKVTEHKSNSKELSCSDHVFKAITKIIKEKESKLQQENRRTTSSNKYNINVDVDISGDNLFIDEIMKEMLQQIAIFEVKKVYEFFVEQKYDTDAIERDIKNQRESDHNSTSCNIVSVLSSYAYRIIRQYVDMKKSWSNSLSTGFRFYYWKHYLDPNSDKQTELHVEKGVVPQKYHSSYAAHELYVERKYDNLKEEMQQNTTHNLDTNTFNLCLIKANSLLNTKKARQLIARHMRLFEEDHYEVEDGTRLKASNLISVIFYTDFDDLSTAFSSTFRKNKFNETLHEIKTRHAEFAIWSRILRETVELFGADEYQTDESGNNYLVRGPFYCGMNVRMEMPQFSMYLCGPTSTSRQIEVAIKFGGSHGIIMQFSTNGEDQCKRLRGFDCCWISEFSWEDECLFMGGYAPIKIDTVRVRTVDGGCNNYAMFFELLYYFDCMINGSSFYFSSASTEGKATSFITDDQFMILDNLIKHKLKINNFKNNYPQYVNETFDLFVNSKTQIVLYLRSLKRWFPSGNKLLMHNVADQEYDDANNEPSKQTNLFKDTLIKLFKNVKHIMIYTTSRGVHNYAINIMSLLLMLTEMDLTFCLPKNFQVTIVAQSRSVTGSWLCSISDEFISDIKKAWNILVSVQPLDSENKGVWNNDSVTIQMNESRTTRIFKQKPSMKSLISYFINELISQTFIELAVIEIIEYAFGADLGPFITGLMSKQNRLRFKYLMERQFGKRINIKVNEYNEEEGCYYFNNMRNVQIEIQPSKDGLIETVIESKMSEYFGNVFGENLHLQFIVRSQELRKYKIICAYSQSVAYYEHNGYISLYGTINKHETEITINYVFYSKQQNPFLVK